MLNGLIADLLMAVVLSVVLMFVTWLVSLRLKNASIVDIVWAFGFTLLAFLYYWIADGWLPRKFALTVLIMSWSLRLAVHLFKRVKSEHPQEDARYIEMRKSFGAAANFKFLVFFQMQAIVMVLLSVPMCMAFENERIGFSLVEIAGFIVTVLALVGEWTADKQLWQFKHDAHNLGEVCQKGWWRFSRHPNYFFEWLVWIGFYLIACDLEFGVWTFFCPAIMLYFLLKVSGVPLAERQSLKSKGEKYRLYQKSTSMFFPWFKKEVK